MKILAFSDLHMARGRAAALVQASETADLVIGAGDFCNARQGQSEAMNMLAGMRAPMVMVPGNAESAQELGAVARDGDHVLHGTGVEIEGVKFFGLGGGVPVTPFGAWSWDLTEEEAATLLAGCEAADILITHSPPYGVADKTSAGQSVGSTAILAAVERLQPRLAVCGHIHDSWGQSGRVGATEVFNLGPVGRWFDL